MKKLVTMMMLVAMVALVASSAQAAPITVSLSPTNDTAIQSNVGYDLNTEKVLKCWHGSTTRRSLLMFDFTDQIPEGMVIVGAQMDLRLYQASSGDPMDIYRASGTGVDSWYEGGGINWAGQTSWTYDLAESTVADLSGGTDVRYLWDLDLNYVEEGIMTFGLLHKHEFGASGLAAPGFNSKEKWGAGPGPWMHVTYDVPEPATMTLLLLGLPFALRRRR